MEESWVGDPALLTKPEHVPHVNRKHLIKSNNNTCTFRSDQDNIQDGQHVIYPLLSTDFLH